MKTLGCYICCCQVVAVKEYVVVLHVLKSCLCFVYISASADM
jgi:hypothetical protein